MPELRAMTDGDAAPIEAGRPPWGALVAGPVLAGLIWALPVAGGMTPGARGVAGLVGWMAAWWLTGAVPLAATALLPLVALPLLGQGEIDRVATHYADPVIFLFLGGFFLAAATQRWGLHRRFALATIALVGTSARRVVLAFMLATGIISMWISNTATAAMMLPIAIAVADLVRRVEPDGSEAFAGALMLGVAYAASIGGIATLIGTPPTAIFAGAAARILGRPLGFAEWMAVGLPVAAVMLIACWLILTQVTYRVRGSLQGVWSLLAAERAALGPWTVGARATVTVFAATALAWLLREPKTIGGVTLPGLTSLMSGLSDAGIAIGAALVLFALPVSLGERRFALDWESAARIPWGVLLLFGGGLALAAAIDESGLARWLGERLQVLAGSPQPVVIGSVALLFIFLTELASNTATAAMGMPVMGALAPALGADPVALMAAAALGSALGFMLPVGTPPNAMVFGTGLVPARVMMRAGVLADLLGAAVITAAISWWR